MTNKYKELTQRLRRHRYNTWNDDLGPEADKAQAANVIDELEAKLAKAVEALRFYAHGHSTPPTWHRAHTVLAELEGDNK